MLFIAVWQIIWASAITSEYKVPSPSSVWDEYAATVETEGGVRTGHQLVEQAVLQAARDLGRLYVVLDRLGVHLETNASEAGAAAMLGASINYPIRGAVAWKSTVGTNVASDALANLASAGVTGGALIVIGEDYGEGSSIMQERTHAFAMKSQIWLLDPRPSLPKTWMSSAGGLSPVRW